MVDKFRHETYDSEGNIIEVIERDYTKQENDIRMLNNRLSALSQKWPDPFSLLDDILMHGIEAVNTERAAIKSLHPKPNQGE